MFREGLRGLVFVTWTTIVGMLTVYLLCVVLGKLLCHPDVCDPERIHEAYKSSEEYKKRFP